MITDILVQYQSGQRDEALARLHALPDPVAPLLTALGDPATTFDAFTVLSREVLYQLEDDDLLLTVRDAAAHLHHADVDVRHATVLTLRHAALSQEEPLLPALDALADVLRTDPARELRWAAAQSFREMAERRGLPTDYIGPLQKTHQNDEQVVAFTAGQALDALGKR